MSEDTKTKTGSVKPRSKLGLILAPLALVVGLGSGFMSVRAGLIFDSKPEPAHQEAKVHDAHGAPTHSLVSIPAITVSLPPSSGHSLLRLAIHVETSPESFTEVEAMTPFIVDMMNSYLRAAFADLIADEHALIKLRAHLTSRIKFMFGDEAVKSVLIQEFIVN